MKNLCIIVATALFVILGAIIATAQMPGDTVGTTQNEYQSNGASGNRIVVDDLGNIHVCWMRGTNNNQTRHVYFNCKAPTGWIVHGVGLQVSVANGAGYPSLDLLLDNRAAIAYHRVPTNNESLYVAIDAAQCQGFFDYNYPPNTLNPTHRYIWPNIAIDNSGRIHLVATWNNPIIGGSQDFMYTRSNNGGINWTPIRVVDTLETISPIVVASPVSGKVAIVYSHPVDTAFQNKNDIYYVMSNDGVNWNWNNKINVTDYPHYADTFYAFIDLDAVFDYNDNLHIIWNTRGMMGDVSRGPVDLWHYAVQPGAIDFVTSEYMDNDGPCNFGPYNYIIAKMSLSSSINGNLYAVYTHFDTTDCAAHGEANGELYAQASFDGGHNWGLPVNITNTPSPGCVQPDCRSEKYPSMAEKVDTALHIFYVGYHGYGAPNHLMMYYSYSPDLLGAREPAPIPAGFALLTNYPNPFNAVTAIEFEALAAANAQLSIFDITGRRIASLFDGPIGAGRHQIIWNAAGRASGIYFARLESGKISLTSKLILLK